MNLLGRRLTILIKIYLRFKYVGYKIFYLHKTSPTAQIIYKSIWFPRTVTVECYDNIIDTIIIQRPYPRAKWMSKRNDIK